MKVLSGLEHTPGWAGPEFLQKDIELHVETYPNGRVAIQLWAPMELEEGETLAQGEELPMEPYMTITVNFPNDQMAADEIAVKTWSENEGSDQWLIEQGIIDPTPGRFIHSGYVSAPVYKLKPDFIEKVIAAGYAPKGVRT